MAFQEALAAQVPPRRVGDVRLAYEDQLLIGERSRRPGFLGSALFVAGLGCAAGCLVALLPSAEAISWGAALLFGALAAALVAGSIYAEQRRRAGRRFVLNFAAETFRVDAPSGLFGRPRTHVLPFDAVKDVAVRAQGRGFCLEASLEPEGAAPFTAVLVDRVSPSEVDALRRVWRVVRAAVGLRSG